MPRISRRSALGILAAPLGLAQPQPSSPTRGRISLSGAWRWKPEGDAPWSSLAIPEAWPNQTRATEARYEREVAIPAEWAGRRITLSAECINSFAAVFVDGVEAGQMRYPAGEVDLSAFVRPGAAHLLAIEVIAMPLKAVMLSYSDTASARTVAGTVARRGITGDIALNAMPPGPRIGGVRVETSVRHWEIAVEAALAAIDNSRLLARIYEGDRVVKEFSGDSPRFTAGWHAGKLWDLDTPGNQYRLSLSLLDNHGREIDTAPPVTFGFREFWIEGREFRLNGSRIYLSSTPLDNAQTSVASASYEATRATLRQRKSFGVNMVYTHNYGCEPGTHYGFEDVLRAADDEGVLVAFSQPHFGQYDWTAAGADARNGYAQHAAYYVRVAGSHPSVVFYSTSHNGAGYAEDMNPDLIDGIHEPRDPWSQRGADRARRAEAILRTLDSSRIVYHHSGGNLNAMHTVNFYGNFIPPQEMDDWFEHWAAAGVKPLFTCEYSVPFLWDWSMYRGWYRGKREFGSAVVPWEFHVAEWDAQFIGQAAYNITDAEKANLRWEAEQFRRGRTWHRWDYPYQLGSPVFEDRLRILAAQVEQNWRAFRTWGLSANGVPWDIDNYFPKAGGTSPVAETLARCNMPLLAYIAGAPEAFTGKDHNFAPREAIDKQLIVINNSRQAISAKCSWSLGGAAGHQDVRLAPGGQHRIPIRLAAPPTGQHALRAAVTFGDGTKQADTFLIDVVPRLLPGPRPNDTVIIPKGALTVDGPAADLSRLRDGLKAIVFEQSADVLEKRLGFRVAHYGLRQVFARVPGHKLLAGVEERHLRNWRGSSTLLPPRLEYKPGAQFNNAPTVTWAGIPVTRVWRAGNRGTVASVLIEKPACGDFMPILDGGYGLQYSPLLEYREGNGMILFCQMDVSERTANDPAAELLLRNIFDYVAAWQPAPRKKIRYRGDPAGQKYLQSAGVSFAEDGEVTAAFALSASEAKGLLAGLTLESREHIAASFEPFGPGSPFTGISPADLHNRDPRIVPVITGGARIAADGILADGEDGRVVFSQLAPWQFDYANGRMNVKRTFRNVARMTARLMANLGAEMRTPLLDRFAAPPGADETRWQNGLYMDTPEEWDDPYRFFRW